jgi:small-conductance mechanosensitive channel
MNPIVSWGEVFTQSLQNVSAGVINFVPTLIIAVIVFAIGWALAALLERLIEGLFKALKIDNALKGAGLEEVVKRGGYNLNSGLFVGALVKWFVIVVFLMASFEMLGLSQVSEFLRLVVGYLPNVIIAVLVLMVAALVANAMQKIVVASSRAAHIKNAELLGRVTKWSIWIFAVIAALQTLGIAYGLIQSIVIAVLAAGALAAGLAFGLGGKEVAQKLLEKTANSVIQKD